METHNKAIETTPIKLSVQKKILYVSVLIFTGKLLAYFISNSIGILTDALESIVNVISAVISLYSINLSLKPKDEDHPYGHGKIELISASAEGSLIILAGVLIIYEAIKRLFIPVEIQQLGLGIFIIATTGIVNFLFGFYSIRVGKRAHSIALVASGKHLMSDTYSTIGLVLGLMILYITKISWIDSVVAILFGFLIIFTGYKILKQTISNLMDEADFEVLQKLCIILSHCKEHNWINVHNLKTVKYGNFYHIECDLTLPWYYNIIEAHKESDKLTHAITKSFSDNFDLRVHTDACHTDLCKQCKVTSCTYRLYPFEKEMEWTVNNITRNIPNMQLPPIETGKK